MTDIRTKMRQEQKLAMLRKKVDSFSGSLGRSTATRIVYCENCKAPVVDSVSAWRMHFMRMPECREAK